MIKCCFTCKNFFVRKIFFPVVKEKYCDEYSEEEPLEKGMLSFYKCEKYKPIEIKII